MKKIIVIAISGILLSCAGKGFEIVGEIKGMADGTKVFLEKPDKNSQIGFSPIDTAVVKNGKFTFKGEVSEPELHAIIFENKAQAQPQGFSVVLENGKITAIINKDSIGQAKVTGTFNNEELNKFNAMSMKIRKRMMDFQQKNMAEMQAASQKNDTAVVNRLSKEFGKFQNEMVESNYKYIETNPKSFIGLLLIEGMFNEPEPKMDKIKKYFEGIDSSLKGNKHAKNIKTKLETIKAVAIGQKAPEFSAKNPDGKTISLKESLGKITIIDFWASWCGPCRQENPNVVALYNEFHEKGLNIIGVSLDRQGDTTKWKDAIAKDKLTWNQVSNLKFWEDPIAVQYGIKSIPATFLLDAKGTIIAKDLRGAELKAKVAELLSK
jgi:peroxiredoxin